MFYHSTSFKLTRILTFLSYLMSELLQNNTKVELYCSCCCESLLTDVGDFWSSRRHLRAERFETFMRPLKGLLQQLQPAAFTCNFFVKRAGQSILFIFTKISYFKASVQILFRIKMLSLFDGCTCIIMLLYQHYICGL